MYAFATKKKLSYFSIGFEGWLRGTGWWISGTLPRGTILFVLRKDEQWRPRVWVDFESGTLPPNDDQGKRTNMKFKEAD